VTTAITYRSLDIYGLQLLGE